MYRNPAHQIQIAIGIAAAVVLLGCVPARAVEYYVDNTTVAASNSNAGTSRAAPWRTLWHAAMTSHAGDTAYVNGDYHENVTLAQQGSAGAWMTFAAYPGAKPSIVDVPSASHRRHNAMITITGSFIEVRGFDLSGADSGIVTMSANHIKLTGNTCHDCGEAGIQVLRGDYVTITGNTCYSNCETSKYNGSGISVYQCWDYPDTLTVSPPVDKYHNVIANNICHDNVVGPSMPVHSDGNGIIIDDPNQTQDYMRRTPNLRHKIPQLGGYLVYNNVCYNNGGRGIETFDATNVAVINNTCFNNQSDPKIGVEAELSAGFSSNVVFENNIAYARGGGYSLLIFGPPATPSGITLDHNLYFNGPVATDSASPVPLGRGDIVGDPQFANPGGGVFTLAATSPCIGSGNSDGAPKTDIVGAGRPQRKGVDIGAYESGIARSYSPGKPYRTFIEAESASTEPTFAPFTVHLDPNASGGQYIADPNAGDNWYHQSDVQPSAHRAQYSFTTKNLETVNIWMRVRKGESGGPGDGFFVSLDSGGISERGASEIWQPATASAIWEWALWKQVELAPGTHSLKVINRKANFGLDCLLVTNELTFAPTGKG